MTTRQATLYSLPFPVFINETGLAQRAIETTFLNESISTPTPPTPKKAVGWRHEPDELERRLKEQRDNTFGRRRFNELLDELRAKTIEVESKPAKAALVRTVLKAEEAGPSDGLAEALEAAVLASNATRIIKEAEAAYEAAMASIRRQDEEDIELLLLH